MNFRSVLEEIHSEYGESGEFTSADISKMLNVHISATSLMLKRLYNMGFFKRSKLKRPVLTKYEKICNRGYYYKFSLNKHGRDYVKYLAETPIRTSQEMRSAKILWDSLSEDKRRQISDIGLLRLNQKFQRSESSPFDIAYRIFLYFYYSSLQSKVEKLQRSLKISEAVSDAYAEKIGVEIAEKSEVLVEIDKKNRLIKRCFLIIIGNLTDSPKLIEDGKQLLSDKELAKARKAIMEGQEDFGKMFFSVVESALETLK